MLIHGNCNEVLKTLDENSIDLTITSPPYFNVRDYSHWNSYEEYLKFLEEVFTSVLRITKPARMCCVNISSIIIPRVSRQKESKRIPLPFHFVSLMEKIGWKFIEDIIWVKPEGSVFNRNGNFFRHRQPVAYKPNTVNEYIFVFQKPSNFLIDKVVRSYDSETKGLSKVKDGYERTNVWYINPETNSEHPAPYPVALSDRVIEYYSYVNDTVLDIFSGSGTTAISSLKLKRNFIGIEIHQEYINIAKSRIDKWIISQQ